MTSEDCAHHREGMGLLCRSGCDPLLWPVISGSSPDRAPSPEAALDTQTQGSAVSHFGYLPSPVMIRSSADCGF